MNHNFSMLEYRLKFHAPLLSPIESDMLMGRLAWALIRTEGEDALKQWIQSCKENRPPFVVSNGYPTDFFPKALLPLQHKTYVKKDEQLKAAREGKAQKNKKWMSRDEFFTQLSGQSVQLANQFKIEKGRRVHAIIDRTTGRSLSEGGLFETPYTWIPDLSLYFRVFDTAWKDRLKRLMSFLEREGFGAKKSSGFGQFSIEEVCEFNIPVSNPNGFIVLSQFVPAKEDPTNGYYRLKTKYGRLGEEFSVGGKAHPFKKPLLMIEEGAFFHTSEVPSYVGRMIEGVSQSRPEVVQFCYGLTIPVRLEVEESSDLS